MYSSSDFEKVWFLYKTEGEPKGISINAFCENQGAPMNSLMTGSIRHVRKSFPLWWRERPKWKPKKRSLLNQLPPLRRDPRTIMTSMMPMASE
jgi:hypothetical protein